LNVNDSKNRMFEMLEWIYLFFSDFIEGVWSLFSKTFLGFL